MYRRLADRNILVVEDEFVIAEALRNDLSEAGARVVGPAGNVPDAMRLIELGPKLHVAVLDANLGGDSSLPVAERLENLGIPVLLTTGYDAFALPSGMLAFPRCQKPYQPGELLQRLVGLVDASRP